jgi:hypothetical protein
VADNEASTEGYRRRERESFLKRKRETVAAALGQALSPCGMRQCKSPCVWVLHRQRRRPSSKARIDLMEKRSKGRAKGGRRDKACPRKQQRMHASMALLLLPACDYRCTACRPRTSSSLTMPVHCVSATVPRFA